MPVALRLSAKCRLACRAPSCQLCLAKLTCQKVSKLSMLYTTGLGPIA